MIQTLPDQWTSHESAPDEAHVGRFSIGLETRPQTPAKLHRGRFSEGSSGLGRRRASGTPGGSATASRRGPRPAR
jgi:hypothetical protein